MVIGGGIAGASAAYWLSFDVDVTVLEAEPFCGYHTTGRSAALLTEAWEHGVPGMLASGSRPFLESPPDGFTEGDAILSRLPVLIVGEDRDRRRIEAMAADAATRTDVQMVDGDELLAHCPVLDTGVVSAGVLEPLAQEIDVAALHQGFLRGVRRNGGEIVTGAAVTELRREGGRWAVAAGGGTWSAEVVVDAAGAWGDAIAASAGVVPLDLQPMRRTAFTFDPGQDIARWPMVIDVAERFYFKPERTQIMGSLSEEHPMHPHDVRPEEIDVARAIDRIQQATTLEIRTVKRTWAGLRTFSPDRDPVNGFDLEVDGFYWLVGQGGFGIMTAPAMGRIAAGIILGRGIPDDLAQRGLTEAALSPGRLVAARG